MSALNEQFGVRRGVCLATGLVGIWKFIARRTLSEPPPKRQVAGHQRQADSTA